MKNVIFRIVILITTLFLFNISYLYSASGEKAGDFTLEGIDGKEVVLSNLLKDRKAVLVFWATWCPHCKTEISHIEKFYKGKQK